MCTGQLTITPPAWLVKNLSDGEEITFENLRLKLDAGGIKAVQEDGSDIASHQAFWFARSQFYPETALWSG